MLQACFALLIEFFVSCFAKIIQLAHKGLHPVTASEIQVEQGILSLLRNCLSHRMTCWVLRAYWAEQAGLSQQQCGMSTSNHVQRIYGVFLIIISTFQDFFGTTPSWNSIPTPLFRSVTSWGEKEPLRYSENMQYILAGRSSAVECFVQERLKAL